MLRQTMMREDSENERLRRLAELMDSTAARKPAWRDDELAHIFAHQLGASLKTDLGRHHRGAGPVAEFEWGEWSERTFGELFRHPAPPLGLLRLVKDFANTSDKVPDGAFPAAVASVLYYSAIVTALVLHDVSISTLAKGELLQGIRWTLHRPWLDADLRERFNDAQSRLSRAD